MVEFNEFLLWEAASRDTIDFKKIYVDIAGDLNAGLMLSEIVYWYLPKKDGTTKLRVVHNDVEWVAVHRYEWWDRTRLSPKEARGQSRKLVDKGVLAKALFKFNGDPTVHIRLVREKFVLLWNGVLQHPVENPYLPKVENQIDQKVKRKRTKRQIPVTETTTLTTTETTKEKALPPAEVDIPVPSTPEEMKQAATDLFNKAVAGHSSPVLGRAYTDAELADQLKRALAKHGKKTTDASTTEKA